MSERVFSSELLNISEEKEVLLKGWIHQIRDLGKIRFWLLRDSEGLAQIVLVGPKKHPQWEIINEIKQEYIISLLIFEFCKAIGGVIISGINFMRLGITYSTKLLNELFPEYFSSNRVK